MSEQEYSFQIISYGRNEDCRILEACFKSWFKDPKTLNFVDPRMPFPFQFKKWISLSYDSPDITTMVIKEKGWIIGYLSMRFNASTGNCHLFHLFIDPDHRRNGLAEKLIQRLEDHGKNLGVKSFSLFVMPKNRPAKKLYEKLDYTEAGQDERDSFKYVKRIAS